MEEITRIIADTLETLIERGWRAPISLTAMGANGAVMVARYVLGEESFECEIIAESYDEQGIAVPLNLFFTNARGDAARVLLETEGGAPQLFQ